jgi:hypothetical protein
MIMEKIEKKPEVKKTSRKNILHADMDQDLNSKGRKVSIAIVERKPGASTAEEQEEI